jgi:hypothetical protein
LKNKILPILSLVIVSLFSFNAFAEEVIGVDKVVIESVKDRTTDRLLVKTD